MKVWNFYTAVTSRKQYQLFKMESFWHETCYSLHGLLYFAMPPGTSTLSIWIVILRHAYVRLCRKWMGIAIAILIIVAIRVSISATISVTCPIAVVDYHPRVASLIGKVNNTYYNNKITSGWMFFAPYWHHHRQHPVQTPDVDICKSIRTRNHIQRRNLSIRCRRPLKYYSVIWARHWVVWKRIIFMSMIDRFYFLKSTWSNDVVHSISRNRVVHRSTISQHWSTQKK